MSATDKTELELIERLKACGEQQAIARKKLSELRSQLSLVESDLIESKVKAEMLVDQLRRLQDSKPRL